MNPMNHPSSPGVPCAITGNLRYPSRYLEGHRPKRPQVAHNDGQASRTQPRKARGIRRYAVDPASDNPGTI